LSSNLDAEVGAVLITGGGKRLGALTARAFAQRGFDVVIHANTSRAEADAVAEDIRASSRRAHVVQAALHEVQCDALITKAFAVAPNLRILINSASVFAFDDPKAPSRAVFDASMHVNAFAPAQLSAAFAHRLAAHTHGAIVHVLDQKLANLNPDYFSYTASKAALAAITEMQAMAFAPRVKVLGVAPGLTLPSGDQTSEDFKLTGGANILQRPTAPQDVIDAILFAATGPLASGQILYADSGQRFLPLPRDVMFLKRAHA
jgi:NAD(P)-dependent dehydrogenase (short-subunit alcohol dehydrogenase family)